MNKLFLIIGAVIILMVIAVIVSVVATIPVTSQKCGIENCHGLDIVCGSNVPDACTEIYKLGDRCRSHVSCDVVEGQCQQIQNTAFDECKACAEKCAEDFRGDGTKAFECESLCN